MHWRWVHGLCPELNKRCRPHLKPTNKSYRTDATYIKALTQHSCHEVQSSLLRDRGSEPADLWTTFLPFTSLPGTWETALSVLYRLLSPLDRVSIGRYFLSFQPQPKLFSNSRNERVLRQSVERTYGLAFTQFWIPLGHQNLMSPDTGPVLQ